MDELMKSDLYELLNISISAEEKEIKKAYRKKALTCHPDKNPDNPKAAELFQQLSKALEILLDSSARAAYDKVLNARKAAQIRNRELDSKRRKLKEDLEAREKNAESYKEVDPAEKLREEIERLRKEGSKLLEQEKELLRQEIEKERFGTQQPVNIILPRLKVRWKSDKSDKQNGGYSQENLQHLFQKYGHITCLLSSKRKGRAIIEFPTVEAAYAAFELEKGHKENPLSLSWVAGQPEVPPSHGHFKDPSLVKGPIPEPSKDSTLTSRDYESVVLMKLRQAEERKKIIQQMMEEED